MENEGKEPQVYEVGYHIVPSISPDETAKIVQALGGLIAKRGGSVISEEFPKMIRLAYTMEKHVSGKNYKYDTAQFGWIKFEASPTLLGEIRDFLQSEPNIIRSMSIKTVRENTLYGHHIAAARATAHAKEADEKRREAAKKEASSGPVSEAEVDKAIEDLVTE